mgnify:CR=1 FL=1
MSMFNFNRTTSTASESTETKDKKEYDNTNKGCVWPNKFKFSAKAPDFTGYVNVDGTEMRVACWIHTDDQGNVLRMSIAKDNGNPNKKK